MSYFEINKRYMQFRKKTSIGEPNFLIKILIRVTMICFVVFIVLMLVDRINFPAPKKNIEKIIPNENFKTIN